MATAQNKCVNLFTESVKRVFDNWTALQLGIEHGMGSSQGQAAVGKFVDYVVDVFSSNTNIEPEDVSDILADVMDSEFQTMCEDESPDEVGMILWKFYQLCKSGNELGLEEELNKIPVSQKRENIPFISTGNIGTAGLESVPEVPVVSNVTDVVMEQEDQEWTQVTTRRKRN